MTSSAGTFEQDLASIPLRTNGGETQTLGTYAGKVLLVVNVASKCGLTPQYDGLEALYRAYRTRGFEVLAFPANDFMGQEPGSDAEIADFCKSSYDVDFPLFAKTSVAGEHKHPLYAALIAAVPHAAAPDGSNLRGMLAERGIAVQGAPEIVWNFEKFLIDRDGRVAARFSPDTKPDDPALVAQIERLLG